MTQLKNIAMSVAHLLEAGITQTERLSMLAYIAAKDGVDTGEVGRAFRASRPKIYGAMAALQKLNLTRQELRDEVENGVKNKVGYWYATPYAKDVLSNFSSSLQINPKNQNLNYELSD
jgi:hypothetical protein|tara:strand:+ start:543 stop:896 length:354 start_codon:yes stop_codon:yes gene_type:complete